MENEKTKLTQDNPWPVGLLLLAWLGSLAGLLGSLYFSEILKLAPCVLCWWQRVFMYPLTLLLPIGIAFRDRYIYRYTLPLSVAGLLVAIYQNLIYYDIVKEQLAACTSGVSCSNRYLSVFGFLDVPQFALLGFLALTVILFYFRYQIINQKNND